MKLTTLLIMTLLIILGTACSPAPNVGAITPPYVDTGIDSDSWATIPAADFPFGQHNHMTPVDEDYEIMVTDVTNQQYADYLNAALAAGEVTIGIVDVEAGDLVESIQGLAGHYSGDPFDGYKHEEQITAGDKLYIPLDEAGLRLVYEGGSFSPIQEYANHPMTMVTWFGANAYCQFYGGHLPTEIEWEKAARGTALVDGHGLPFPWGQEIEGNHANYYSSFDLFEKLFGKLGNTTPVGMYNGRSYDLGESSYQTQDAVSPYGLYDMAGNVWQWTGDDYSDQHYRYLRGGSFYSYEVDLRVWKNNSAGPQHYGPDIGFRCARN